MQHQCNASAVAASHNFRTRRVPVQHQSSARAPPRSSVWGAHLGADFRATPSFRTSHRSAATPVDLRGRPRQLTSRARDTGRVNYMELLAAITPVEDGADDGMGPFAEDLLETVALAIYANRAALLCTMREQFDPQSTGTVSAAEFADGLAAVSAAVLPRGSDGVALPRAQIEARSLPLGSL